MDQFDFEFPKAPGVGKANSGGALFTNLPIETRRQYGTTLLCAHFHIIASTHLDTLCPPHGGGMVHLELFISDRVTFKRPIMLARVSFVTGICMQALSRPSASTMGGQINPNFSRPQGREEHKARPFHLLIWCGVTKSTPLCIHRHPSMPQNV